MKILKKILLVMILLIIFIYVTNVTNIPNEIILFKGENLNLHLVFGLKIDKLSNEYDAIQTASNISKSSAVEKETIGLNLFNIIKVKNIEVNTIPKTSVIPLGNSVGLKLYTSGVLVVGMTEVKGQKPYENSGIEEGDMIVKINEKEVTCTAELIESVNDSNGEDLNIKYIRDGVEHTANIEPIKTNENEYKLGLWVRDGAAGIGTITYYEPSTKKYAALGHGIVDIDTNKLINISAGELVTSRISSIVKGKEGTPGEIKGSIVNGQTIGNVGMNTAFGIYGNITNSSELKVNTNNEMKVANRDDIKTGNAKILLNLENGVRKEYDINIEKIYKNNNSNNKSMLIKVTDEELIDLTGGIIQRNEWSTNNTKQQIYRGCNSCFSK